MKKLLILSGISGSGKTTYASKLVQKNPDVYCIVSRDIIRYMFGYDESTIHEYYNRKDFTACEKTVTEIENVLIKQGLSKNKIVVVDNTHLKPNYIEKYKQFNVNTDVLYFDIELEKAIENDKKRKRQVGKNVIQRQYQLYKELEKKEITGWKQEILIQDKSLPKCVVFDLDGTLAINTGRSPYDWDKVDEDDVNENVATIYDDLSPDIHRIICTGRSVLSEEKTKNWLSNSLWVYSEIYFRKKDDYRPDWQVKKEMWQEISKNYNILYLIDDRNQVVDYARSLGLEVFQVNEGNF